MADADRRHPRAAELNESPRFHAGRISRCRTQIHKLIRTHLLFNPSNGRRRRAGGPGESLVAGGGGETSLPGRMPPRTRPPGHTTPATSRWATVTPCTGRLPGRPAVCRRCGCTAPRVPRPRPAAGGTSIPPGTGRSVIFDQRGCGRSRPLASGPGADLPANTTDQSCRRHGTAAYASRHRPRAVAGGSWDMTLGLVCAQRHPERVPGMVLAAVTDRSHSRPGALRSAAPDRPVLVISDAGTRALPRPW